MVGSIGNHRFNKTVLTFSLIKKTVKHKTVKCSRYNGKRKGGLVEIDGWMIVRNKLYF